MEMTLNKKGVFFTFLSITLVSIMIILYTGVPEITVYKSEKSAESEFKAFNAFTKEINDVYINRALNAHTNLAVRTMLEKVNSTNMKIDDLDKTYRELMFNSTINDVQQPLMKTNLTGWSRTLSNISWETLKIKTNITFYDVRIFQADPWHITVNANASIRTEKGKMQYMINDTYSTDISIIGLKDPIYLFNHTINRIYPRRTITGWAATTPTWDEETALDMIRDRTYRHTEVSPSFLMRLVNDTSNSSCCGIESLINGSFGDFDRSYVDYLFFNQTPFCAGSGLYNYSGITDTIEAYGFKLDCAHEKLYNLSDDQDEIVCGVACS